jgi:hypothetical protein
MNNSLCSHKRSLAASVELLITRNSFDNKRQLVCYFLCLFGSSAMHLVRPVLLPPGTNSEACMRPRQASSLLRLPPQTSGG